MSLRTIPYCVIPLTCKHCITGCHTQVRRKAAQFWGGFMLELASGEFLEIALSRCRKEAVTLGDELLVYLIDMAIFQIRTISLAISAADTRQNKHPASARSAG